ncbi:MAG: phospholipid/cholesterol/gamma-HCH transport system substrate-binding protein [Pseudonocardiales bacterium]|jgi:phospholipid/cholesterol/gamma-HCH transport system substrate-binding protein|nr:phospholipid/cholesterol/gamma-HCH transport system substrate-binding protein [Pseudonocardiales bacterium]MDQ1753087.1 phospholipid/cholesterol/gamma-HCH transport system substrate-binding protein [Pseudonocardiales bacterium]
MAIRAGERRLKKAPRGRSFASRNPTVIGAIGLVVIGVLLWAAFNAQQLPIIGGGTQYTAIFSESSGLVPDDEVRIAGVKVGTVNGVSLTDADDSHVQVKFRIKNAFIGDQTQAIIKIKTVLGRKYLELDSQGANKQDPTKAIPLSRTLTPYDVYPAFSDLTKTVGDINTKDLGKSLETIAQTFKDTPGDVSTTLNGLSRLSNTIASRDQALRTLLARANSVTGVLADRDAQISKLLTDGNLLLDELNNRRDAIRTLFLNTSALSLQISALVADNQRTLKPALDQLNGVLQILQKNTDNIDRGLALLAPFYRVFANTLGNGRWFDTYISNLSVGGLLGTVTGLGG